MCSITGHQFGKSLSRLMTTSEAPHITRLDFHVLCGHMTPPSTREFMTKEKGFDGVSTQLGSARASVTNHPTLLPQAQPCDWSEHLGVTSQRQVTEHRLQSRSQMSSGDHIHLCMICLDRCRELAPPAK